MPDIDIDTPTTFNAQSVFADWPRASIDDNGILRKHPCGVYAQKIAVDPITKLAAIPYDAAEDLGFLKIDFLHLSLIENLTRQELQMFVQKDPDWTLLQQPSVHPKLFQLAKHGDLLCDLKPKSIQELADVMALIRPGKKNYAGLYKKNPVECRKILFASEDGGYSFKRSHSLAYSFNVVIQLHLIEQKRL